MAKIKNEFEGKLLEKLSKIGLKPDQVKKVSSKIAEAQKNGLVIDKTYIIGQPRPNVFYSVGFKGIVDPEFTLKFNRMRSFSKFDVFPLGKPKPDTLGFKALLDINSIVSNI